MSGAASLMNQTKMDSDGKLVLIDAVKRNDESEIKRLIDAGVDVNQIDDQDKTALFYATEKDNDSIVLLLIDAGADVEARDDQEKTALFYAAANKSIRDASILAALVEKGNAVVNACDKCGRTPLFYAITTSIVSTRYLLDHDANLKADFNVRILTFVIEEYLMKQESPSNPAPLSEVFDLLIEKGLQTQSIVQSIINLVFCKIPLLFTAKERETIEGFPAITQDQVLKTLKEAKQYLDEGNEEKAQSILLIETKIKRGEIFEAIEMLSKLGADPNSADSAGNTALHYATLLPMMDVSQETVMKICDCLMRRGLRFDTKNHQSQTPLLFCLSENHWKFLNTSKRPRLESLVEVCKFLLKKGFALSETSQSGETVFHLLMKLSQQVLNLHDKAVRQEALCQIINLLNHFSSFKAAKRTINIPDDSGNIPLHLWAALTLSTPEDSTSSCNEDYAFEKILRTLLECFLKCGANVNARNNDQETPLHSCKTWAAVKLLIKAKANANDLDSSHRSPLLVATVKGFYLDIADLDPKEFWKNAIEMGLDPWTADEHDNSVLGNLLKTEAFDIANALLEVSCEGKCIKNEIKMDLLNVICKDPSRHTHWKSILVKIILDSRKISPFPIHTALLSCCRNIKEYGLFDEKTDEDIQPLKPKVSPASIEKKDEISVKKPEDGQQEQNEAAYNSVHCEIAKLLLSYGADVNTRDSSGKSCLDIAENCPPLKDFLMKPLANNEDRLVIPWTSTSKRYKDMLKNVAKQKKCDFTSLKSYWYHKDPIASGRFGNIYAGVNVKDGREVAIKKIEKLRLHRPQDKRETGNLTALADCQQVVRYICFLPEDHDENFCYVVLELMEGNLEEYLNKAFDKDKSIQLCRDVVMGIKYLHKQKIIHRDVKPTNILYKVHPKLCLKLADFGLSRCIDGASSNTVYSINSVGTKCWIAPEVLKSDTYKHSESSDIFSCGLVLYYLLSVKGHPFSPADYAITGELQTAHEIEANLMKNEKRKGWDDSLCPEATHLVEQMLKQDSTLRPTAGQTLDHPLFWSKEKKISFLEAVGNQTEFQCPCKEREPPLTAVEEDLNNNFKIVVRHGSWTDPEYLEMQAIYTGMTTSGKGRKSYDTSSVIELVRFIRNVYEHFKEKTISTKEPIGDLLHKKFVFLENFPHLVMEVYKAVTTHSWDQTRDDIKYAMNN